MLTLVSTGIQFTTWTCYSGLFNIIDRIIDIMISIENISQGIIISLTTNIREQIFFLNTTTEGIYSYIDHNLKVILMRQIINIAQDQGNGTK